MPLIPIRRYPDPVLRQKAEPVDPQDPSLPALVADMFETMYAADGVGLAANQIGLAKRIAVIDASGGEDPQAKLVLLNPVLLETSGEVEEEEGCLSFPGGAYPLKRAEWARVEGFDGFGEPVKFEATGWFARVIQHEYDHLDGKLYVNRLMDRYARKALKQAKKSGWGVPGLTWMPGVDPDPFGH